MPQRLFHQYGAIRKLERSMGSLRRAGLGPGADAYDALYKARADIWRRVGIKQPRITSLLRLLFGLSPGTIKVWHDAESGWFSEARERPGAPPVYHHISDEIAITLLKGKPTPELEKELLTPEEYLGE